MFINERTFPIILIFLDVCAAIVYASSGDIKHMLYWVSAAVLTMTVTF